MKVYDILRRVVCCFFCFLALGLQAREVSEQDLKAAYLYNFALFTTWPTESSAAMVFCVFKRDTLSASLEALQGKKIRNRPITVRRIDAPEEVHACDVVFLGAGESEVFPKVLEVINDSNILTVTDSSDALRRQMAINMAFEGNKLIFEVNLVSARRANLTFSSKLLNLAKSVN